MNPHRIPVWRLLIALMLLLSACAPGGKAEPLAYATPTALDIPLPPALVEADPPNGGQLAADTPLTFFFNQPMNRASVEAAINLQPPGTLTWTDDYTLVFTPSQPYPADKSFDVYLDAAAAAANGLTFPEPVTLTYRTADSLRPVQVLPEDGAADTDPTGAIVVVFNQPVVPLGADPASLPAGFLVQPSAAGHGEWLNTSTCIFYPDPSLAGGTTYTVRLNPGLVSTAGSALDAEAAARAWTFTTALPRLVSVDPDPAQNDRLGLLPDITLTFNQPMDPASVEGAFIFSGPDGIVNGQIEWNEGDTAFTFTPSAQLRRATAYSLILGPQARALGGTTMGEETRLGYLTYGNFELVGSYPIEGGTLGSYRDVELTFSVPLDEDQDLNELITVSPAVSNLYAYSYDEGLVSISASYDYETAYTVTLSPNLKDAWGQPLGRPQTLRFTTAVANPVLEIPATMGYSTIFLRTGDPAIGAYATNLTYANISLASMTLGDFIDQSSNYGTSYTPANPATRRQNFALPRSRSTQVEIILPTATGQLSPGLYYIGIDTPEAAYRGGHALYAAASDVNVIFKRGDASAMVWAVFIDSQQPVAGAAVAVYNRDGALLAEGRTDEQGIWQGSLPTDISYDQRAYLVMVGQPGQSNFGLAVDSWYNGVGPWDFGVSGSLRGERPVTYLYSDRPIYRPGQTVYFRGVIRDGFDGRYAIPDETSITLTLDNYVETLTTLTLPISPYGTFEGEYTLPETTAPGYYVLHNSDFEAYLTIPVADYRKPEFELSLALSPQEGLAGDERQATVEARYYFDAPVGGLPVSWRLYARPTYFPLPGYSTGTYDDNWFGGRSSGEGWYGTEIASGEAVTGGDGKVVIDLPALEQDERTRWLTLEVTAADESGLPVSARTGGYAHPSDAYIGIRSEQWVGQAGTPLEFEIITAGWQAQPLGNRPLTATFHSVTWERTRVATYYFNYTPVLTEIASANLTTGADGKARLSFTPPTAGTYVLDVQGAGNHSQYMVWVSGGATAAWPDLGEDRIELTSDQDSYQPGDTARVLIPNPFGRTALALITIERDTVLSHEIVTISGTSLTYSLPLTDRHAPNVYVGVTLLDRLGGFRMGLINLPVEPSAFTLKVELTAEPQRSQPGGKVTLDLRVTDQFGAPVQGEFSVAVVDKAALALADPNSGPILKAYYGNQPLGMLTSLSLAAASDRLVPPMGGRGGGGGDGLPPSPRENFPDTAYWNPTLVTGANGRGQVQVSLPDNLTTWTIDVRGITTDTRVGQGTLEIVATKDLLIRPVTPRFLVQGDHLELSAVVNNNTASNLQATVSLNAAGFVLDDPAEATRKVTVPANGRVRVAWWGTVVRGPAELIFSVKAGDLEDSSRPVWGALPVLQYTAPRTFVTAGVLAEAGTRNEVISLPRSFVPTTGDLSLELNPSLASMLISTLDILEVPPADGDAEWILSYFLPNLEVYRALQASGLENPALQVRLESSLEDNVRLLVRRQNEDGGWGWHAGQKSDLFISAYVLFGLGRFREAGLEVGDDVIQRGREYLISNRPYFGSGLEPWELDRVVFIEYALFINGGAELSVVNGLYDYRDGLSPWAQALLALMLADRQPDLAAGLITNLETGAIRTASGAHWESADPGWYNPGTSLYTTAVVVYTLARRDPANPLLTDAVRYLASHRRALGGWGSTYDNAWILLALTEAMRGSGELQAGFDFSADFNTVEIASGSASGPQTLTGVSTSLPLSAINPTGPNLLEVTRTAGTGRLYYRASLMVSQPVEQVEPLDQGIRIQREYLDFDCAANCTAIQSYSLSDDGSGLIVVRILVSVPVDTYYLVVEDYLPAGTEVLNKQLNTTQRGAQEGEGITTLLYDRGNPFAAAWGWWFFSSPRVYDDHIQWSADYLPAGTYTLTYTLVPTTAGEFRVLPVRAWLNFFPEVQGTGGGQIFTIKP